MLGQGADVNITHSYYGTALQAAVYQITITLRMSSLIVGPIHPLREFMPLL